MRSLSRLILTTLASFHGCLGMTGWKPPPGRFHPECASFDLIQAEDEMSYWMKNIPDKTPLGTISIPGTHNSLSWDFEPKGHEGRDPDKWWYIDPKKPFYRMLVEWGPNFCQNEDLKTQLESGIRYLDIPIGELDGRALVTKDMEFGGKERFSVMLTLTDFLHFNPSETLIVRLRSDQRYHPDLKPLTEKVFSDSMNRFFASTVREEEKVFRPKNPNKRPTMGELRGKILFLTDFDDREKDNWGIASNSDLIRPNTYVTVHNLREGLNAKWKEVDDHLEEAKNSLVEGGDETTNDSAYGKLYVTYANGGGGPGEDEYPAAVAAGDTSGLELLRPTKRRMGINERLAKRMDIWKAEKQPVTSGIVVMDFPGWQIVEDIVSLNWKQIS